MKSEVHKIIRSCRNSQARCTANSPWRLFGFHVITAGLLCIVFIAMVGCNTLEGAGKDIEEGGEAIQDVAD